MKHSFKTLLTLALALVAGNAWGETKYTQVSQLDLTTKSVGCAAYNTSTVYGDWKIVNGANNNKGWAYFKMGGKNTTINSYNPCYIYSTEATTDQVDKITVSIAAGSLSKTGMSVNSWGVYVYSDKDMTNQIDYVAGGTITNSAATFDFFPSAGKTWASGYYYKVSWNLANTTSTNGIVCVDKITLYKAESTTPYRTLSSIAVSGQTTSFYVGDEFKFGGTVTASYVETDADDANVTSKATFSGYDMSAAGEQTVTVSYTEGEVTRTATYEITVNAIPEKTIAEFISSKGGKCYLTGIVSNIANTTYGNFDLTDESGTIYVYGCLNSNGEEKKFSTLDVVAGDKIKVLANEYKLYGEKDEAVNVIFVEEIAIEKAKYVVTIETPANGTLVVKDGENTITSGDEIEEGTVLTIEATPTDGYKLRNWQAVDGSTHTYTTTFIYTIAQSAVTISANFDPIPQHTVLYSSLGEEAGSEDVYEGETIASAPTVTAPAGWTFTGWTTEDDYEQSTTAPTFFSASTPVTEDVILYAVFSKLESGSTIAYNKVIADQSDWRGDYLIAYSRTVFMDGSLAGGKEGVGTAQSHVSPGSACSDDEMTVTAEWGDEHYVTIEAIDDTDLSKGYVIKSHSLVSPYFYQTTNSNGMAGTDNKATAAKYPISIVFNSEADIDIALGGAAAGAILHYNKTVGSTGEMFRFYKDGGQQPIYLYKKTSGTAVYSLAPKSSYDATITSAGFATLYLDFAAAIPTGVTAYTAVAAEDAVTLTEIEDVIPAETAVVLEGAAGTYTFEEATTTATAPANNLVGTLTATDWATVNDGKYIYVLGQKDGVVGFYKLSETGTIKANSAYLALDEDPASGSIIIRKGDATAISFVQENGGEAVIYDLLGRRVSEPMRGIYIVNGKKMFIK